MEELRESEEPTDQVPHFFLTPKVLEVNIILQPTEADSFLDGLEGTNFNNLDIV